MPEDLGSIELYMGPHTLGAPDNLEETIVGFIDGAREELSIAVQELESIPIAEAIIRARQRGVSIRLILERDYLTETRARSDPWQPGGSNEANRRIHGAMMRARVPVTTDLNPDIYHQKYVVRDRTGSRAALLTGSTNFTPTGTHHNLNHVLIFHSKRIAGKYGEEFDSTWGGRFGRSSELGREPTYATLAGLRVKALFAPEHAPELEIMKQMLHAQERVEFAMFTFARSSGIDDTMIALHRGGIPVRGVLDRSAANQEWAATRPLANAGAQLFRIRSGTGVGKLHHKLMVVDDRIVIAGSFNYTGPANSMNDENIVVIGDILNEDPDAIERQRRLAAYARTEIDRIRTALAEPV